MANIPYEHPKTASFAGKFVRRGFSLLGLSKLYLSLRESFGLHQMHNPGFRFFFSGMYDFLLHEIYWMIATVSYRLKRVQSLSQDEVRMVDSLMKIGFAIVPNSPKVSEALLELERYFWPNFEEFQARAEYGYRPARPVLYKGMMAYPAVSENQIHYDGITNAECQMVWQFLLKTGCLRALEATLKTRLSVFNVRCWRYLPKKTQTVRRHRDNLPPHAFKIMYFRGWVDRENGALNITDYQGRDHWLEGQDSIVIIDVNRIYHEGHNPKPGKFRDCIEVCLMPELFRSSRIQYSGFEAEHPYNPFLSWQQPASKLIPLKPFGRSTGRLIGK